MGLLDNLDDPKTQALLSLGLGLLNSRGNFGQGVGQAGTQALGAYQSAKQAQQQKAMQDQQMQSHALQQQMLQQQLAESQRAATDRQRQQAFLQGLPSPQMQASGAAMAGGGGPTQAAAGRMAPVDPMQQLLFQGVQAGIVPITEYIKSMQKDHSPVKLGAGEALLDPKTFKPLAVNPKEDATPSAVREYEYAVKQGYGGTFEQWDVTRKKAGATNIGMPKIEVKMGESVAGQIGPMAKDSRIQAQGAVGMFDSADRIQRALDSGKVSAGPFTTQVQTVKQLVQKVAGGSDEGIRQTRQVIKGLAQMSVEARKELQGQGQVTESEAAAVAKAESGDINDLTTGELQDLVTLTKRAAHFRAKSHQTIIDSMAGSEATKGMIPFYQVNNIDRLLKHSPQLPQIGGGDPVAEALKKYGGK